MTDLEVGIACTVLAVLAVVGLLISDWLKKRQLVRIQNGDWRGASTREIATALWQAYFHGLVEPSHLERLAKLPAPFFFLGQTINQFICLDIAAGRYHQALEWRGRWRWKKRALGDEDEVLRVNEAEALACLGRHEEALARAPHEAASHFGLLVAGVAAHRAWVLAELGRVEEARREHAVHVGASSALGPYLAEWHLSRFAVEFAAGAWDAAAAALDQAAGTAVRESSKRNVHFLRGRLAFARGQLDEAVKHFELGAASPYRWQGGPAWLDYGDALQRLGREVEARTAWQHCVERDGQSPAAATARQRLG